jgi:hypothetical protein
MAVAQAEDFAAVGVWAHAKDLAVEGKEINNLASAAHDFPLGA